MLLGTLGLGPPSAVGTSHQRNSGYKAEQVKYHDAKPLKFSLPFSSVRSGVGSDQAAGKRVIGGVH